MNKTNNKPTAKQYTDNVQVKKEMVEKNELSYEKEAIADRTSAILIIKTTTVQRNAIMQIKFDSVGKRYVCNQNHTHTPSQSWWKC